VIAWGLAGWLFAAAAALDAVAAIAFLAQPIRRRIDGRRRRLSRAFLAARAPGPDRAVDRFVRRRGWLFLEECARVADAVEPTASERAWLRDVLVRNRIDARIARCLLSRDPGDRMRAAVRIPLLPTPGLLTALVRALETERRRSVKLFMAAGLAAAGEGAAIPTLVDTLSGEPAWFQRRIAALLAKLGDEMASFVPMLAARPEKEIQLLLIHVAGRHPSTVLRDYLVARVDSPDRDIAHAAFRALTAAYAGSVDHARWLVHDDFLVRNLATESLGGLPTVRSLGLLFEHADDPVIRRSVTLAVTNILRARPQHVRTAMIRCLNEARPGARAVLVDVLAGFVDDLAARLGGSGEAEEVLTEIARHGRVTEIITFLNRNADRDLEHRVLLLLADLLAADSRHAGELARYLDPRLAALLGLEPAPPPEPASARPEHPRLALLYAFLAAGLAAVPAVCLAVAALGAAPGTPVTAGFLPRWVTAFNAAFAVYAASLNGGYLLLLAFSIAGSRAQARAAALLGETLLFTRDLLPSVSIISPAFNEEASIVESVSALLDLRYPDFEVIVVNDGSRDRTLERMVAHFALERTEIFVHRYLATQDIRATWRSRRHPGLVVIDKANGGKADALNAGINAARKDYFAGIDADSLLERDALLGLAGQMLFSDEEVVAAGGNIMPVNGCTVLRGDLAETRIPRRPLACFQTVEYLRAFMAGRIGWAAIRSLLIISGAFGVFHRRRVVDAHGYLTRSEHYLKDTVGEDMELVVRLTRNLHESRTPYAVLYAARANCWTEIPETFRVLNRQRDRWQRGLLDIVTFHYKMMANPAYGRAGLVAFPYFLVYEVLGPWFEAEGTIVFIASLALGMIGLPLLLLMLSATVLLGLAVSLASFAIAEHQRGYFPPGDRLVLVLYALAENFGFRQMMSLLRVRGFVRMLARVGGWGRMERRGFGGAAARPGGPPPRRR
jgi:cellulose synthase/poly-beta-1,6-N-acetylglucosamine synthase-like glycosyltransferase/HEAT repeat protein